MSIKHTLILHCITDWNHLRGQVGSSMVNTNCEKAVVEANTSTEFKMIRYFKDEEQQTMWRNDNQNVLGDTFIRRTANNVTTSVTTEVVDTIP